MSGIELWDKLSETDRKYTKDFNKKGFRGTNVNPMYVIRKMTKEFGPNGQGWGYDVTRAWTENDCAYAQVEAWYKKGDDVFKVSPQIGGTELGRNNDEAYKMSITDGLMKSLSLIGASADIYLGDDSGNTKYDLPEPSPPPQQAPPGTYKSSPTVKQPSYGVPPCPKCGGEMWDNREKRKIQQMEVKAGTRQKSPMPAFGCKKCGGIIWKSTQEEEPEVPTEEQPFDNDVPF